jgi:hypothetical protein
MTNPAIVEAKDSTFTAVAGTSGAGSLKCLPPVPHAMIMVMNTGIQARRSYHVTALIPMKEIYDPVCEQVRDEGKRPTYQKRDNCDDNNPNSAAYFISQ